MAARALWKAVVCFGDERVPVKLYAAVNDRSVHFRLLHRKDKSPVRQAMVSSDDDRIVPYEETKRAFVTDGGDLVVLDDKDLKRVEPAASRDMQVLQLLPLAAIDHRWYRRPYYVGPDKDDDESYGALVHALQQEKRSALVRWVMRNKEYVGSLRLEANYLMLITLHFAGEVIAASDLPAPGGPALRRKDLDMARKLMDMLVAEFDPAVYADEYRARVDELIAAKADGGTVARKRSSARKPLQDLSSALEASLKAERKRA